MLLILLLTIIIDSKAQVQLQSGVLSKSIPLFTYIDKVNPQVQLGLSLDYNSGNGLIVDEMPGEVGTGWSLSGIPKIIRIQKGLPDDQQEITGSWNTFRRAPGYLYNNTPASTGCPTSLNYYPTFYEEGHTYYQDNTTIADREIDEFRLEIGGRIIPFVLNKNGGNCIVLDNSKVKIFPNNISAGNITVLPVTTIFGFRVIDENGAVYDFGEAEVSRSFIYKKDQNLEEPIANSITRAADPVTGPEYVISAWYISSIRPSDHNTSNLQINFEYTKQVYDFKYMKMLNGEVSTTPYPFVQNSPNVFRDNNKDQYSVTLPAPYNTNATAYFKLFKLSGTEFRTYVEKKMIKHIYCPDNSSDIEFKYNFPRKDLPNTFALSQILVNSNGQPTYGFNLTQSYFVKNEIKNPVSTDEEQWSRLCLTNVMKVGSDNFTAEKPYNFDYYTGTDNTEDFVPPPFFQAKDPFGYYNGSNSGVPTTRKLTISNSDFVNWAKVCFHNGATITGGQDEIVFNPKINYARNGLLKSITIPTGGKETYEYNQNFVLPTIQDYDGLKYKSFESQTLNNGAVQYAYRGVSLSKVSSVSAEGNIEKYFKYDYVMPDGTSSRWGVEAGRVKFSNTTYYEAEHKTIDPLTGACTYEFRYPATLNEAPIPAPLGTISDFGKIINSAIKIKGVLTQSYMLLSNPSKFAMQSLQAYTVKWIITAIASCLISGVPSDIVNADLTSNDLRNTNLLPSQFRRTVVTEYSGQGDFNGSTVYEFTSPDDFPLLVPGQTPELPNNPRSYTWMYGLSKKISIYDKSNTLLKETENNYTGNDNQILANSNTQSCNCQSVYTRSLRGDTWLSPSTYTSYITSSNSGLKVDFYNLAKGNALLINSKESIFKNGISLFGTTNYSYNNNNQVNKVSTVNSKGAVIENRTYYPSDYNLSSPNNANLLQLVNANKINLPVSLETWQTKPGQSPELLSTGVTEFGITPNGDVKPVTTYGLQTDRPVPQSTVGVFDPDNLVRNRNLIKPVAQFNYDYWAPGPKEVVDISGNKIKAFIYRYPDGLPVATITNANADDCYFIPTANFTSNSIFFSKWTLPKESKLTYIANAGNKVKVAIGQWNGNSWVFSDISPVATETITNTGIYYEYTIPQGYQVQVRNENNCQVQEFRFYPKNALMQTIAYDAEGKKISECDINNHTTYYEYDGLGRITKVLDENHNIIKTYEYHFKN